MDAVRDREFWAGKSVLVTGHTGFKGAWLTAWLLAHGADVTGLSVDVPTTPSLYELAGLGPHVRDLRGDLRDLDAVLAAVATARPDVVLHLGARSLVRPSYSDPVGTYAVNVLGTAHVLEAVRRSGRVPVTLVVTSDKCYDNREWAWGYREYEPKGGSDPYSSSKGCAELVTDAYRASYFSASNDVRVATARAGNVLGGGDWSPDRLVPDVMRAALAGSPVRLRNPTSVRPWQHVLDCLDGYLQLVERLWADPSLQGGWNFGPDTSDHRTVADVVTRIAELWPGEIAIEVDTTPQPHEAHLLALDCAKARQALGWRPTWTGDEALSRLVDWYAAYAAGSDVAALTGAQVSAHSAGRP